MSEILLDLVIIFFLFVANGVLALSEMSIVSSRKPRLQQMAENGSAGAKAALELASEPGQFLSTVQVGITLVGILAGAYGSASFAAPLAAVLAPLIGTHSQWVSVAIVVTAITYLSLIIGELVPKRLALANPEGMAALVARPLSALSRLAAAPVKVLSVSTEAVVRMLGLHNQSTPAVTEDEVRLLLEQGAEIGVFEPFEEEIVGEVFRLADRKVVALLTPRTEIVWIDANDTPEAIRAAIAESGYSRFPVAEDYLDRVIGMLFAKDLLAQSLAGKPFDVRAAMRPAVFVPETMPALEVIERFKQTHSKMALVIDEFGGVEGLVTVDDLLTAMVGDFPESPEEVEQQAIRREDGSWLLDGMLSIDRFQELLELRQGPENADDFQTVGGFVMSSLGHVPVTGDRFEWNGLGVEVVDMDGRRVDKVLVTPLPPIQEE